jgi:putative transposase
MVFPMRQHPVGVAQHIVQSTIERRDCFVRPSDYVAYLKYLQYAACRFQVAVHAWVIMRNHCHLLLTPVAETAIDAMLGEVRTQYLGYCRSLYPGAVESLQAHYLCSAVQADDHVLRCCRYIEANPVRASLVATPADYRWSSYGCSAQGVESDLWVPHSRYRALGADAVSRRIAYRRQFADLLRPEETRRIRACLYQGKPYGAADFCQRMGGAVNTPALLAAAALLKSQVSPGGLSLQQGKDQ